MSEAAPTFDPPLSLTALLRPEDIDRLCASLSLLLDSPVALQDLSGTVIGGAAALPADSRIEILCAREAVAYLQAPQALPAARQAAAKVIAQLLLAAATCLSSESAAHRDEQQAAQRAHAAALAQQSAALAESEARQRALSEDFAGRVAAQVALLDEGQRQSYQAERLASVGALAAGVAHEINNPIAFVRSNLRTAETYLGKLADLATSLKTLAGGKALIAAADVDFLLEDFSALLHDSIGGVDRVARIVSDLKGFSNIDKPEEDVVDLNELISSACTMAEKRLPPGAALVCVLGVVKPLLCLPGHLAQALLAILNNAVQAVEARGATGEVRVCSRFDGRQALIEVSDNGAGIEASALPRVFDPFYTTRPVGKGTGLGLTMARDIIRAHGGEISFDSVVDGGTTVTVSLPD
ncbi:MAG: two-component sensor histidine kinase [Candidatus Accumulibacter meliphilus]|uniref:histidine kinase n=1 Tax=Candidatus Accumulibacter meliphilus TaxID=2211374 RepID=A0A369XG26_9PROT|nr:MAG: two-component sensor histidine kinase [Candidatus Accumulibacter meliphilus]